MKLHKTAAAILKAVAEGFDRTVEISKRVGTVETNVSYHAQFLRNNGLLRYKDGVRGRWELVPGVDISDIESREPMRGKVSEVSTRSSSGKIERLLGQLKGLHDELESEFIALSLNVFTPKEKEEFERLKEQDAAIQAMVKKSR